MLQSAASNASELPDTDHSIHRSDSRRHPWQSHNDTFQPSHSRMPDTQLRYRHSHQHRLDTLHISIQKL